MQLYQMTNGLLYLSEGITCTWTPTVYQLTEEKPALIFLWANMGTRKCVCLNLTRDPALTYKHVLQHSSTAAVFLVFSVLTMHHLPSCTALQVCERYYECQIPVYYSSNNSKRMKNIALFAHLTSHCMSVLPDYRSSNILRFKQGFS